MFLALALTLLATTAGALATYLYDDSATVVARLCAGACTGLAALGLLGFIFASFMGLTPLSISLSAAVTALPLALLSDANLRARVRADLLDWSLALRRAVLRPAWSTTLPFVFYALIALLLWMVFERALFELPEGLYTGVLNNYGDLPFHLSVITGFARGENFPPQDPTFAGVRFTYPFLADFVAAMFARAGASLRDAMLIENFVLGLSFVGLLHRWTLLLVRDRLAAHVAPLLVLFSGGLGWLRFLREAWEKRSDFFTYFAQLPQAYTISGPRWRWGNALTTLLVPQRGILFALPLAILIFTLFRQAIDDGETLVEEDAATRRRGDAGKDKSKTKKGNRSSKTQSAKTQNAKTQSDKASKGQSVNSGLRVPASPRPGVSSLPLVSSLLSVSPLRRMIAAGIVAGLLPLVHAHTLMVVLMVGGALAVLRADWRAWVAGCGALALLAAGLAYLSSTHPVPFGAGPPFIIKAYVASAVIALGVGSFAWLLRGPRWREWLAFFAAAAVICLPQLWWATRGSAVQATSFLGWQLGWDHGDESVWLFWLKNTGLFIPLLVCALVWPWKGRLVSEGLTFYYLPFTLCFIIPNLVLLAPWVWDNIKVLFFWYVGSVPLVALLLARWWRNGALWRAAAVASLLGLVLAGALDVWGVVGSEAAKVQEFDRDGIKFAAMLEGQTRPRSLVLHAPTFNHPVFLTGRQSLMGYPGHIWTHGLKYQDREAMIKRIYAGGPDAAALLASAGVEYVVVSPVERQLMWVNDAFFAQYAVIAEAGGYRLYKIAR
jgi:hypothetical protein